MFNLRLKGNSESKIHVVIVYSVAYPIAILPI